MKFDTDGLKASLKNYQQKTSSQFRDFTENDWPDIKDRVTEKGQQAGDYLRKDGGKVYQNSIKASKESIRDFDQWANGTSVHRDDK